MLPTMLSDVSARKDLRLVIESPIIPLYVRDTEKTFKAVAMAFNEGVFINPVIPPACAPQDTLVRYALMANHTHEQVDESVVKLKKVFKELEIL